MADAGSAGSVAMAAARRCDGADAVLIEGVSSEANASCAAPAPADSVGVPAASPVVELWQPRQQSEPARQRITGAFSHLTLLLLRGSAWCHQRELRDSLHPNRLPIAGIPVVRRLKWVFLTFAVVFLLSWPFLLAGFLKAARDLPNAGSPCIIPIESWILAYLVFAVSVAFCLLPVWVLFLSIFVVALAIPMLSVAFDADSERCSEQLRDEALSLLPDDILAFFLQAAAFLLLVMRSRPHVRRLWRFCRHRGPTPPDVIARVTESVPRCRLPADYQCTICYGDGLDDEDTETPETLQIGGGLAWRGLPCGHAFHEKCLYKWLKRSPRCPLCRGSLLTLDSGNDRQAANNIQDQGAGVAPT